MNRILHTCLLFALLSAPIPHAFAANLAVSASAPDFSIRTLTGQTVTLNSLRGKVVLLHFWATWCPPCREEFPVLQQFYQQHQQDGLEIIAVSMDNPDDMRKVRAFSNGYTFPIASIDTSKVAAYGRIWRLPLSYVIDRDGILRKADWTGEEPINAKSLETNVLPWLKPASQAEIQSH